MPIVDAHQHYWQVSAPWHEWPDPGLATIHRDFMPDDLAPALAAHDVVGTVLVQSQPADADTDWMLALAERTPSVLGVVGWIDPLSPRAPSRLATLARHPKLKGVRAMWQDRPADMMLRPAALSTIRAIADHGLVLDALVRPHHLPALATIAARYPDLSIVVDHAAKPDIATGFRTAWAEGIAAIAAMPRVSCKLSGLVTEAEAGWRADELIPYIDTLLARFGAERLVWGSDWPVSLLRSDYGRWLNAARAAIPIENHAAVFGDNATRLYALNPPGAPA